MTILDKIIFKGAINFYLHTPITYLFIYLIFVFIINKEWEKIRKYFLDFKNKITPKLLITSICLLGLLAIAILARGKINDYLVNQNVLNFPYWIIQVLLNLQFLAKSLILLIASFILGAITKMIIKHTNNKSMPTLDTQKKGMILTLVLIAVFITVKALFIAKYSGNYEDDWLHIAAGSDFWQTFKFQKVNSYFEGNGYIRGMYMSALVNLFLTLFGHNIIIAKIAPALVGLVNFILLLFISKKVLVKKTSLILFSYLYIFNPFVIFNQLYIRMYVFYEMFFLIMIILGYKLLQFFKRKDYKKIIINLFLQMLFVGLIIETSNDRGSYIFVLIFLISSFLCAFLAVNKKDILKKFKNTFTKHKKLALILSTLTVLTLLLAMYLQSGTIMNFFVETNDASNRNSLIRLLCYTFAPLTLSVIILPLISKSKNLFSKYISILSLFILLIHLFLPTEYQLIRGFNYAWGILFLSTAIFLEQILNNNLLKKKIFRWGFYILFVGSLISSTYKSYSNNYLSYGPSIQGEVAYYKFTDVFNYINENLSNKILVESTYNVLPNSFFNKEPNYLLDLNEKLDSYYFPQGIPFIKSLEQFKLLTKDNDVCVILRNYSYSDLLTSDFVYYLEYRYYPLYTVSGFDIWCKKY